MKNKISLFILLIGLTLVLMPSCKKVADEIVGTWDVMTFDTRPEGSIQITFDGNSTAIRILNPDSGSMKVDSCTYEVIQKGAKKRIIFRDSKMLPGCDALNGIYRVDKVKNDVIMATRIEFEDDPTRGGAFYRMELKRKN
ncbi:MAG: hypothetical protein IIU33_02805 [Bacteroidales bacterium]|nr:hypothetical protein [Bacteroidales bacterium]MBQ5424134.1 hypothetical protein [Bacteroidales bacterium]